MHQLKKTTFLATLSIVFAVGMLLTSFSSVFASAGSGSANGPAEKQRLIAIAQRMMNGHQVSAQDKRDAFPFFQQMQKAYRQQHPTPPAVMNTGGPDNFGYRYIDSFDGGFPAWSWINGGTSVPTNSGWSSVDDGYYSTPIDIGFTFNYYGTAYTQVMLGSNGHVDFGSSENNTWYTSLPSDGYGDFINFFPYDDIVVDGTTTVTYQNLVSPNRFVVTFNALQYYGGGLACDAQIILYQSGEIQIQYGSIGANVSTIGICANDGSTNGNSLTWPYVAANSAVKFYSLGQVSNPIPADAATSVPTNATLAWDAATEATGYDVYFDTNPTPITEVSINQAGTTFNPGALTASTTYYWQVNANNGVSTNNGPIWSFTTGTGAAPNAPDGGNTSAATTSSLQMNWNDNSSDETGFPITSSTDGSTYNTLTTAGVNATSYNNSGLNSNSHYWYRVYAQNGGGTSTGYASANGWTLALSPGTPTLSSNGISSVSINIIDGGNNAATRYAIYETGSGLFLQADHTLGATAVYQTIATWGTPCSVSGLTANTTYHFEEVAENGANVATGFSSALDVTTSSGYTLPYSQNFSSWPPADWQFSTTGGATSPWQWYAATPNWMYVPYYTIDTPGEHDYALTPPISTVGASAVEFDYDWAYGTYAFYHDTLYVAYTTDGGTTYNILTSQWGDGSGPNALLAPGNETGQGLVPPTSGWSTAQISLPAGALNQANLQLAFIGVNEYGNHLFITNVHVYAASALIAVHPTSVTFPSTLVGSPATQQSVYVLNTGVSDLHITNVSATSVVPGSTLFTVTPGDSVLLTLDWTPGTDGPFSDNVTITSDASNNGSLGIPVTGSAYVIHTLPYTQDFSGSFPPTDWSIINPDGLDTWAQYSTSPGWAYMDFWDYTNHPQTDYLVSPPFNTVGVTSAEVDFNWSYYGAYIGSYDDSLEVAYSTDGGSTWNVIWSAAADGNPMSLVAGDDAGTTNPATTGLGLAQITVPAGALNQSAVQFAWIGYNAFGPDLFVTNINIYHPNFSDIATNVALPLNYGYQQVGTPTNINIWVYSTGVATLNVSSIVSASGDVVPSWNSNAIAPGDSLALGFNWTPSAEGPLNSYAVITSDANNTPSDTIYFMGNGYIPAGIPNISISYDLVNHNTNLSWAQPAGTIDGYKIYRESTSGLFNPTGPRLIADVAGAANTTFQDAGVTGQYYYIVTAYNAASSSSSSLRAIVSQGHSTKIVSGNVSSVDRVLHSRAGMHPVVTVLRAPKNHAFIGKSASLMKHEPKKAPRSATTRKTNSSN